MRLNLRNESDGSFLRMMSSNILSVSRTFSNCHAVVQIWDEPHRTIVPRHFSCNNVLCIDIKLRNN
eukprot:4846421-Amphidinium_carterae.1